MQPTAKQREHFSAYERDDSRTRLLANERRAMAINNTVAAITPHLDDG
jgi:hypothetical protein